MSVSCDNASDLCTYSVKSYTVLVFLPLHIYVPYKYTHVYPGARLNILYDCAHIVFYMPTHVGEAEAWVQCVCALCTLVFVRLASYAC